VFRVDTRERTEIDSEITGDRKGPASGPRHITLDRALEPVPVERDRQDSDSDQDPGADCGWKRAYASGGSHVMASVTSLNDSRLQ
jgi:hypothetical protein